MREHLEQYVNLLFAGTRDCEDMRQEILQNTLDRYDDLIAEGKVPEAAYRLAIAGIGDIHEILGTNARTEPEPTSAASPNSDADTPAKKWMRAIAVGLYILCPVPLIVLANLGLDILGVCLLLTFVAVATVLIILGDTDDDDESDDEPQTSEHKLKKSIHSLIGTITVVLYFTVSFLTGAWSVTWIIFLLSGAVKGLINAILDWKEANQHEN